MFIKNCTSNRDKFVGNISSKARNTRFAENEKIMIF